MDNVGIRKGVDWVRVVNSGPGWGVRVGIIEKFGQVLEPSLRAMWLARSQSTR